MGADIIARGLAKKSLDETIALGNKITLKSSYIYEDNTKRDDYFASHPLELIELQYIKVGNEFQQRLNGVWDVVTSVITDGRVNELYNEIINIIHIGKTPPQTDSAFWIKESEEL